MKTHIAPLALALAVASPCLAQSPGRPAAKSSTTSRATPTTAPSTPTDRQVFQANEEIPKAEIVPAMPGVVLAGGSVEAYLLQKEHGPFMVKAMSFKGPDATRYAVALTHELRTSFRLPAYILHTKIKPGNSNIRGVQPQAEPYARNNDMAPPERFRVEDEAVVLVGNCKTTDEAEALLKQVKKMHPECLKGMNAQSQRHGKGLKFAFMTSNPLIAAQHLFPGKEVGHGPGVTFDVYAAVASLTKTKKIDPLVARLNSGSRSVYRCPGPYTLQVYEFNGRREESYNRPGGGNERSFLEKSPLVTAHEDAERLADFLAKNAKWTGGMVPYVYHDRTSSKVFLGSFRSPDEPAVAEVRKRLEVVPVDVARSSRVPMPLTTVPVLVGTREGLSLRDAHLQRTSGEQAIPVPELIPIPTR